MFYFEFNMLALIQAENSGGVQLRVNFPVSLITTKVDILCTSESIYATESLAGRTLAH